MMKVVLTGGGTAGHIMPAIAIKTELLNQYPHAEIYYIGKANSLEADITSKHEDITFHAINVLGISRKNPFKNIWVSMVFYKAYRKCLKLLKAINPQIVIGTGGYVSAPVIYAATKLKIPTVIHEQNAIMGLTNKWLARRVDKVLLSFAGKKGIVTGNPAASTMKKDHDLIAFPKNVKKILVFGGSLGASRLNDTIINFNLQGKNLLFILVTGKKHYHKYQSTSQIIVKDYLYNMASYMKSVDLIVARSGATTIAEICAIGKPVIFVPSPNVTNNHQEKNADYLLAKEACLKVSEKDLATLLPTIEELVNDKARIMQMINAQKQFKMDDAATLVVYEAMRLLYEN